MKELSREQKAQGRDGNYKVYTELINRLEDVKGAIKKQNYGIAMDILCKPYPEFQITASIELKESEDERMMKELIHYFSDGVEFLSLCSFSREEIIAWLEKQDPKKLEEQFDKMIEADLSWLEKSTDDKIEPKFNIGDIIFNKKTKEQFAITDRSLALQYYHDYDHLHEVRFSEQDDWEIIKPKFHEGNWVFIEEVDGHKQGPFQIKEITQYGYTFFNERRIIPFECESLMTLWTIADAKDGDVLASELCDSIILFKGIKNNNIDFYCDYDFSEIDVPGDRFSVNNGQHYGNVEDSKDFHPATKEQRDLLFKKMKEAGYEWNTEKLELNKIESEIEIPFGAKDSELQETTYYIPKGFHAEIDDDKVVIKQREKPIAWSEEDEKNINFLCELLTDLQVKSTENEIKHGTNSRSEYYYNIKKWLKSIKDRVQPKPEWSVEDKLMLMSCIEIMQTVDSTEEQQKWLKSLKDKYIAM